VIGELVFTALGLVVCHRLGIRAFEWGRLTAATLAAAVMAGVLWSALANGWPHLLVAVLLAGLLYCGLCVLFGALRWEEVRNFARALRGTVIPVRESASVP
jgi:hypothetical protein